MLGVLDYTSYLGSPLKSPHRPRACRRSPTSNGPQRPAVRVTGPFLAVFHVFYFSFILLFLMSFCFDFWTPWLLKLYGFYNINSTFSCFQKVSILDDFWPPKMRPNPRFFMFWASHFLMCFCVFDLRIFQKTLFYLSESIILRGPQFFMFSEKS